MAKSVASAAEGKHDEHLALIEVEGLNFQDPEALFGKIHGRISDHSYLIHFSLNLLPYNVHRASNIFLHPIIDVVRQHTMALGFVSSIQVKMQCKMLFQPAS